METSKDCMRVAVRLLLFLTLVALSFAHGADARTMKSLSGHNKDHPQSSIIKHVKRLKMMDLLLNQVADTTNTQPYVSSPFTLPPYDSLPPVAENAPPFSPYPQNVPQPPPSSITLPSPTGFEMPSPPFYYLSPTLPSLSPPSSPIGGVGVVPSPPLSFSTPNPPQSVLSPPTTYIPSPSFELTPPGFTPTPPYDVPYPPTFEPSPPTFLPPIVYPLPAVPSPRRGPSTNLWCVAKPSVPDPIIQEAMNYACGYGADCNSIQPSGTCFAPDTVIAHASFAFNSFWQRNKVAGATCEFGGTAMLVTMDPSYDGCRFDYY
ncbi:hypothetical protein ACFE04_025128 [Oxalis oulophora]